MGIQRKTKFGFPPSAAAPSTATIRMVPLTQGVRGDVPWTDNPPGSAASMVNYLPVHGALIPRSRLSSMNTIRASGGTIQGLGILALGSGAGYEIYHSSVTLHGLLNSNGSISRASFVSAFGMGTPPASDAFTWQYAQGYSAGLDLNVLVAAPGSGSTLQVVYRTSGGGGPPQYSFITGAPNAACVGALDNYIIAFRVRPGATSAFYNTRVQWCARGEHMSGWTKEGSGFEDLLSMRGVGSAVKGMTDGRVILFSDLETWQGQTAPYPAQFQFAPLDTGTGCPVPGTIAETEHGLLFVGSDNNLRLLPTGGGPSRVVAPSLHRVLRNEIRTHGTPGIGNFSWAMWDRYSKLYYLFITTVPAATAGKPVRGFAVNPETGEWGYLEFDNYPTSGVAAGKTGSNYVSNEGLFFGNSSGTIYSYSSLLATDSGSTVTSTWQSAPLASELPANYMQVTQVDCDYRATSRATVTLKISQDGGSSYGYTAPPLSLRSAPVTGRATSQPYAGSAYPMLELTSTDTGFELHRLDVSLLIGGQR
jgi:hypothetical protein